MPRRALVLTTALAATLLGLTPAATAAARPDPVQRTLAGMTLDEKIGQLFETYAYGDTATTTDPDAVAQNQALYGVDNGAQLVARYHLGSVIYFSWTDSLENPTQMANLSNGLQQASLAAGQPPLLISTDQEGGNVTRIGAPLAVSPGNMAIGASFSPFDSYATSNATGRQLKALGINVNDAPVVDVNTNAQNTADGPRSFGDRAPVVAALGAASVLGYQHAGVAATAKHFPGLGSTSVNTDNGVAVTNETRKQFEHNDLPAFRAAIAAGTDEIMAAHIIAPALDPSGSPASVSKPIVTGLLRNTLHYKGVVVTDALSAAALESIPDAQRAVRAFAAGDDILLMPDDLAAAIDAVRTALTSGRIPMSRLDRSVLRILRLKEKLGLFAHPYVDASAAAGSVGTPAQNATAARAASDSLTLVRNAALPLTPDSGKHILITGWGSSTTSTLAASIAAEGVTTQRVYTGSAPSAAAIAASVAAACTSDVVVVTTDNAWGDTGQQSLVDQLIATGTPVIVVAMGGPYDLAYIPAAQTFVAAYGYQPPTLTALVAMLFGASPHGHLPVTIRTPDGSAVVAAYGTGTGY